ncbi:MAG: hypothetical protein CFE26_25985 [Verrucomicrobiales bacterium VVV1]|nr:MAG: hypothetical protein CFE26_25985 [Verrucomicrobiales bacterium VVV1]
MRWIDRLAATILIDLKDGSAALGKGTFPARIVREISEIITHEPSLRGYLWIEKSNRWKFSDSIPEPIQQRIRNVLGSL